LRARRRCRRARWRDAADRGRLLDGFTRKVYRDLADDLPARDQQTCGEATPQASTTHRGQPAHLVAAVEHDGLEEVRKLPGYHDEPLRGDRAGQRSIRLSRAYRAIYEVRQDTAEFVAVEEVGKHEY